MILYKKYKSYSYTHGEQTFCYIVITRYRREIVEKLSAQIPYKSQDTLFTMVFEIVMSLYQPFDRDHKTPKL